MLSAGAPSTVRMQGRRGMRGRCSGRKSTPHDYAPAWALSYGRWDCWRVRTGENPRDRVLSLDPPLRPDVITPLSREDLAYAAGSGLDGNGME